MKTINFQLAAAFFLAHPIAAGASEIQHTMPSDARLRLEAGKQSMRSAAAIARADEQAKQQRPAVPDVMSAAPLTAPAPDPAAIAQRYAASSRHEEALYIMVSFSMPEQSIARLAEQARKAGAALVLRGVVDNSLTRTAELAAHYVKKYPGVQFQVDPSLFRRFAIIQVPTFVLAGDQQDSPSCGKQCATESDFVSVAGDVTLDYALEYMSRQRDGRLAQAAATRLKKIRRMP